MEYPRLILYIRFNFYQTDKCLFAVANYYCLEWIAYGYVEGIGFFERRHVEITAFSGFVWCMECIAHVGSHHEHIHIKSYAKPCA